MLPPAYFKIKPGNLLACFVSLTLSLALISAMKKGHPKMKLDVYQF